MEIFMKSLRGCFLFVMVLAVAAGMYAIVADDSSAYARRIKVQTRAPDGSRRYIPFYSGYYALVIGVSDYSNGWPPLPNPVRDARYVAKALKELGFEVRLVTNPDSRELRKALSSLVSLAEKDPDKAIFVYFAGHGHTITKADGKKLGYIVPTDAPDPTKDLTGFLTSAVSMREIEELSSVIRSRHVLMAFDSCFSGSIFRASPGLPSKYIREQAARPVRAFITAGNENEEVPDESVFKTVLVQGIVDRYADRNHDGYVTGDELGLYVKEEVVNYTEGAQHPQYGRIRNPDLDKGDFIFVAGGSTVYQEPSVIPESATGTLMVETSPSGAVVYVQGRNKGRSPVTIRDISPGQVDIEARLSGYNTERKRVTVRAGRTTRVKFFLDRVDTKGRLYVNVEPSDARVRILNIVPRYYDGIELEAGRYHIEVSRSGYQTHDEWVELGQGEDLEIQVRLEPVNRRHTVSASGRPSGATWTEPVTGMEFVWVPGGCFEMGCGSWTSDCHNDEKPVHTVCVDGFYMGKYEVTQGQWKKIMHSNPSRFNRGDNYPVEMVSWNDVQEFIRRLNRLSGMHFRLPTEAEWEYACRSGGKKEKYCGGSDVDQVAWYDDNSGGHTHPVGTKAPNGLGIYDMSGNVWEWCQDWYSSSYYSNSPRNNPQGPSSGSLRVVRGGGWSYWPWLVRLAGRSWLGPALRLSNLGFRLALPPGQAGR